MSIDTKVIQSLLADYQSFHSTFQLDYFVIGHAGGETTYGRYKQAIQELYKRWRGLKQLYHSRAIMLVDIEELEVNQRRFWRNKFNRRRDEINLTKKRLDLVELHCSIKDTEREFAQCASRAAALKDIVGELTPERRARLDQDMWKCNLRCLAATEIISTGRIAQQTLEIIRSTPKEWRKEIMLDIFGGMDGHKRLIDWFINHDEPARLPEGASLSLGQINLQKLLEEGSK